MGRVNFLGTRSGLRNTGRLLLFLIRIGSQLLSIRIPQDDVAVLVFSSGRGCTGEAMAGESDDTRTGWDAPSGGGSSPRQCTGDAGDGGSSPRQCVDDVGDGG